LPSEAGISSFSFFPIFYFSFLIFHFAFRYNLRMTDADPALAARLAELRARESPCRLCPRNCFVARDHGETGYCRSTAQLAVAAWHPHFGEERCLVGTGGSGAIFLAGCNLHCAFCQNHDLSCDARSPHWRHDDLVYAIRRLADAGCENINFVTPTHFAPQLAEAIVAARRQGLTLPVVWNCGGYETVETLRLLDGLVDIYMPDFKFWSETAGERYAQAPDYAARARDALREMHRQVGDLEIRDEIARRGLLVRHLVLPGRLDDGRAICDFLAREISPRTFVNVMGQYRPMHRAAEFPEINRPPTEEEILAVRVHAERLGLRVAE
jgi:putative pyruvate formate lyase activating enzyme